MKNSILTNEEIIKIASTQNTENQMDIYTKIGRLDLATKLADERIKDAINRVSSFSEDIDAAYWAEKCDERNIPYDKQILMEKINSTEITVSPDFPTKDQLQTIEEKLKNNDLSNEEREALFNRNYYELKKKYHDRVSDIKAFVKEGKKTGFYNLGEHIGLSREQIVLDYLDLMFQPSPSGYSYSNFTLDVFHEWEQMFSDFVNRENIDPKEITSRAREIIEKLEPRKKYGFAHSIAKSGKLELTDKETIKLLKEHSKHYDLTPDWTDSPLVNEDVFNEAKPLIQKSLEKHVMNPRVSTNTKDTIQYGIEHFGWSPEQGFLYDALENIAGHADKSLDDWDIRDAINLLSEYPNYENKISALKERFNSIRELKGQD